MRFTPFVFAALLALGSCASCATTPVIDDAALPTGDTIMPALTFTADSGTDQLAITAHGLLTGDGPFATRNVGGALPGGLAAVTSYFVIRVGADAIKAATSSTNAHAGTAIDITDNGSGTNILEIGVPYRRPRTYANGSILFPEDLNANFDAWPALHALLTGQAQSVWDGVTIDGRMVSTGADASLDLFETTASAQRIRLQAPAALSADFTLTLPSALPAARAAVTVSSTGQLGFDSNTENYNIASAVPATGASFLIAGGLAPTLILGGTGSPCPVIVSVGDTITAWSADFVKNSNATVTVTATLLKCVGISVTTIGVAQTNSANAPGSITLGQSGLSAVVASGESYVILVQSSSGSDDAVTSYSLTR
jgi:hypothetical protein